MITFENVSKKFSSQHWALFDVSFEVKEGEILAFLGPSGSGKTTALRLINRLIEPTSGEIFFNGENILSLDPISLRRSIGYAIQHIGLFPHMSVAENIAIVPQLLQWPKNKIQSRVETLLDMVGLSPEKFSHCLPAKLSGGQKQRVGVARALAADPPVILMDEPFGALDPLMREQLQNEFLEIQSKIKKTIVFVTHDITEAVKMGTRIAVFEKGKLLQVAKYEQLLQNPADPFVEKFFGKNRFQLLLQTKGLKDFQHVIYLKQNQGEYPKFSLDSSLMETFLALKMHSCLSIFDDYEYIGELHREKFLETLFEIV